MALVPPIRDDDAPPEVRAVFDDIRATRKSDYVNDFWRYLANDPATLRRDVGADQGSDGRGALDPMVKELIYLAVSATNNCDYCIHTHHASARAKGMSEAMFAEAMAVTALANANNRLANGYRMDVDERYRG